MRPLLAKTGAKVVEVPPADNFEQIRAAVRLVAKAVGEEARGEALIAHMDDAAARSCGASPGQSAERGGMGRRRLCAGPGGLFDALLTAAGARNVEQGSFGYYDVESLIAAHPDALVYGDTYAGTTSLRADQDLHPALMQRYAGRRISLCRRSMAAACPKAPMWRNSCRMRSGRFSHEAEPVARSC